MKAMYIIAGVIALLLVLALTGKKSVHHEISINASVEKVWKTLTDMESYPDWNPTMKRLEGEVIEGNKVKYLFTQEEGKSYEVSSTVANIIENKLLNQKGGVPWVLTFNHKYIVEAQGSTSKVIIHEDYTGLGVHFWNPAPVEEAYQRLNEALKTKVEGG